MIRTKLCRSAAALGAVIGCLSFSSESLAISIGLTTANNTTTSTAGPTADRAFAQSLSVTDAGESVLDSVGASVDAATRYISNAAADRAIAVTGSTARATINTDYSLTITVTPDNPLSTYELIVDTSILGELTLLDDVAGSQATAKVSDVVGRLNGVVTSGLGIGGIAQTFSTGTGTNAAEERNIAGSNSLSLGVFSGVQVLTLRYTFQTEASSPQSALGGDEAAARFGANGPLSGAGADDYPGPGDVVDRNQALDGHFVKITANVLSVPEPSSYALGAMALFGMAAAIRRKRRS